MLLNKLMKKSLNVNEQNSFLSLNASQIFGFIDELVNFFTRL